MTLLMASTKSKKKQSFEVKLPEHFDTKEITKLKGQLEKKMKQHALNLE